MSTQTPDLTPTEDLILEVLAARHRLGESLWTFDSRHAPAIRRLADKGLATLIHGTVPASVRASLTDAGRALVLSDGYVAPVFRTECPAFYIGHRSGQFRVDCDRDRRHKGKHRRRFGPVDLADVTWLDDDEGAYGADPLNPVVACPAVYHVPGTTFEHRCERREGHGPHPVQVHRTDLTGERSGDAFRWTGCPAECPHRRLP